tara:strand:- start:1242 stop:1937 length:696 start_codon:yes stop_codon:yes gene_type:complete
MIKSDNHDIDRDLNIQENITLKEELNKIKTHLVKEGDTLSSIARLYSISLNSIIDTNNLKDKNYIYIGQNLLIPDSIIIKKNFNEKDQNNFHQVKRGETLTDIAFKYGIKLDTLIKINKIEDPNSVNVGEKLLINELTIGSENLVIENNTIQKPFKTYGPLKIKSNKIDLKNNRKILDAVNTNGEDIIISLNCDKKEIDVRAKGRKWKGWLPAKKEFEKKLLEDFCSEIFN